MLCQKHPINQIFILKSRDSLFKISAFLYSSYALSQVLLAEVIAISIAALALSLKRLEETLTPSAVHEDVFFIVTSVRTDQPLNAYAPISLTLDGTVTFASFSQLRKA